ncbi:MAG: DUF4407 domain-containing protein [Bacteroidales bacterium]
MQKLQENEKVSQSKRRLPFLYHFFCWCSGARLYLLKQCPTEYNKYYGIGVIVFLTGIMASLSGGYAIYTVFRNLQVSLAFGALWGFLIFSIDWYIVASLRKHQNKSKEFATALPRFILALLIAFVVSMPLKMKLFEREINQQIVFDQQQSAIGFQNLVNEEFVDIERIESENRMLRQEIAQKEEQRNKLFTMIIDEAEGMSPTRTPGKGPVYREKKAEYDKVDEELKQLIKQNNKIIQQNLIALEQLREKRNSAIENAQTTTAESDGFLARLKAMGTLNESNASIRWASWFIILLFITIESAPIIVKLLSARGPYDDMLESEEYIKQVKIKRDVVQTELTEDHHIDLHSLLEKERNESLYEVEKQHIKSEALALSEINTLKIKKWKEKELSKLDTNTSNLDNTATMKINEDVSSDNSADSDINDRVANSDDNLIKNDIEPRQEFSENFSLNGDSKEEQKS